MPKKNQKESKLVAINNDKSNNGHREQCSCTPSECSISCPRHRPGETKPLTRRTIKKTSQPWRVRPMQISHFLCPDVHRMQIRGTFCDLFFPPNSHQMTSVHGMFETASPDGSAVTAAGDALSLLQLGVSGADRGILTEAHKRYGIALSQLRKQLDQADATTPSNDIAIAVYLLTACAVYHSTDFANESWTSHELALLKLLMVGNVPANEPGSAASKFLQWRYAGMPMYALSYGLIQKRAVLFDRAKWQNAFGKQRYPLTVIVMLVPGCLERIEKALADEDQAEDLASAVKQALELRTAMHECIEDAAATADTPPYSPVAIETYPAFHAVTNKLPAMFTDALDFADLPAAQHIRIFWTSLLVLDEILLALSAQAFGTLDQRAKDDITALEVEADTCVDNLCRSLPYFTSLKAGTVGSLSAFETLYHLECHFLNHDQAPQLEWCRAVKERFVPGHRIARVMVRE